MKSTELPIHILISRSNADPRMSTLVFETIRIGFPENPIEVTDKTDTFPECLPSGMRLDGSLLYRRTFDIPHWRWIDWLILHEPRPFIICDTDMIFKKQCNHLFQQAIDDAVGFAGEYVPAHFEPFLGRHMMAKWHTALLFINAPKLKPLLTRNTCGAIDINLSASPFAYKFSDYWDTCSHLQCVDGSTLTLDGTQYWDHLHCGTWSKDLTGRFGEELRALHQNILDKKVDPAVVRTMFKRYIDLHSSKL